jgi:hypothetical protein
LNARKQRALIEPHAVARARPANSSTPPAIGPLARELIKFRAASVAPRRARVNAEPVNRSASGGQAFLPAAARRTRRAASMRGKGRVAEYRRARQVGMSAPPKPSGSR